MKLLAAADRAFKRGYPSRRGSRSHAGGPPTAWLDPEQTDAGKVLKIAREVAVTQVEFYPVSKLVNNAKNQGADLIEPINLPA